MADIERGARNPSLESIHKLAEALQLSLSGLFDHDISAADAHLLNPVEIVLVEDNGDDANLALAALKKARLSNRIQHFVDGESALSYLFSLRLPQPCPPTCPVVVLLDLNLPGLDGRELLRIVKLDSRTRHIPVVVLTVSDRSHDINVCRALGAEAYIVKPVNFQQLANIAPQLNYHWTLHTSLQKGV